MLKRVAVALAVLGSPAGPGLAIAAHPARTPASEPHLVAVSDIVVPIIDGNRMSGRLSFDIVIDASDERGAKHLTSEVARLRSLAVVSGLEFSRLYVSGLRPVDAEILASELTRTLQAAQPEVDRVLIVKVAASMG
ncbi:MAG: hypothetical protein H7316_05715 [Tardiphaga sp.]|uniref:hypothetical protein n=1 Tax=Tardiphaga sp. TaxID=1926292 RepID=UPI001987761B|nr:hypothetical protein [Tardiphaga sp.]MBC7583229.1 hypothetical protein [Tardiphaga sp.]